MVTEVSEKYKDELKDVIRMFVEDYAPMEREDVIKGVRKFYLDCDLEDPHILLVDQTVQGLINEGKLSHSRFVW